MQTTQQTNNSTILVYLFYGLVLLAIIGVIVSLSMSTPATASVATEGEKPPQAQGMMRGGPLASASTGEAVAAKKEYLLTTDEDGNMQQSAIEEKRTGTFRGSEMVVNHPNLRLINPNPSEGNKNHGMIIRNDGDNTYFLHTTENNPTGGWDGTPRPLSINNATGKVLIDTGLDIKGDLKVDGSADIRHNASVSGNMKVGSITIGNTTINEDHLKMLKGEKNIYLTNKGTGNHEGGDVGGTGYVALSGWATGGVNVVKNHDKKIGAFRIEA